MPPCVLSAVFLIGFTVSAGLRFESSQQRKPGSVSLAASGHAEAAACRNWPIIWVDSEGDDCSTYDVSDWCTLSGGYGELWGSSLGAFEDYAVAGVSAFEACCACGGGFIPRKANQQTLPGSSPRAVQPRTTDQHIAAASQPSTTVSFKAGQRRALKASTPAARRTSGARVAAANRSHHAREAVSPSASSAKTPPSTNNVSQAGAANSSRRTTTATFECFTTVPKTNLTVVTVTVGLPEDYVAALRENRGIEGERFGYEYCEFKHNLDPTRPLVWSKIRAIQELLDRGRRRVLWMDADAFVVREKPFEEIINKHFGQGKDIVFTDDLAGAEDPVNIGVIAMRNSPWTQAFWKTVYKDFPFTLSHPLQEQQAVTEYRRLWRADFDAHAVIIRHDLMNNVGFKTGNFVAHLAGGDGSGHNKYWKLIPHLRRVNKVLLKRREDLVKERASHGSGRAASRGVEPSPARVAGAEEQQHGTVRTGGNWNLKKLLKYLRGKSNKVHSSASAALSQGVVRSIKWSVIF